MDIRQPINYDGHDAYREPLYPSNRGVYQQNVYQQDSQTGAISYQPPYTPDSQSTRNLNSLKPYNDVEFRRVSDMLLEKSYQIDDPSLSAKQFLYENLSSLEYARFSAALAERYKCLSMYPSRDERNTDKLVRQLEKVFGKAAILPTTVDRSLASNHSCDNSFYQNQSRTTQSKSNSYQQSQYFRKTRQLHEYQSHDPGREVRRDSQTHNLSPRTEESIYREKSYKNQEGQSLPNSMASRRGEKRNPRHYDRQTSNTSSRRQSIHLSSESSLSSPIVMKRIDNSQPSSPEGTISMPIVGVETVISPTSNNSRHSDSAVLEKQSAMRKALMTEKEATTEMLKTLTPKSKEYKVYSKHLQGVTSKLQKIDDRMKELEFPVLQIDDVLEPASDIALEPGSIKEIDSIIPPASQQEAPESKKSSILMAATERRDKTKQIKLKQRRSNGIPNDIIFDKDESCKADSITLDGAGFNIDHKIPSSSRLKVVAPVDLPEGFDLDVIHEGKTTTIQIPKGGVLKGDTFESVRNITNVSKQPELGKWRGSLFQCLAFGMDHPMFCHSCFCPQIALTQIMARMHLSNYGEVEASDESKRRVRTVLLLSVGLLLLNILLVCAMIFSGIFLVIIFSLVLFVLLNVPTLLSFCQVAVQTRRAVRRTYHIPEQSCDGCEDLLVSVWCTPCSIAQMMHHTADYDTYRALWFSETGLPDHVTTELPPTKSAAIV